MISKGDFKELVQRGRIASVRVVPVPFDQSWCIDAMVRTPREAGSATRTIGGPRPGESPGELRKFASIDAAARFLRGAGVTTFTVDTGDAVSFANLDEQAGSVLETTRRVWSEEDDEGPDPSCLSAV